MDAVFIDKLEELQVYQVNQGCGDEVTQIVHRLSKKVREYGARVMQLNELKTVSIQNEDYLTAKRIKEEVDTIKKTVRELDPVIGFRQKSIGAAELAKKEMHAKLVLNNNEGPPLDREMIKNMMTGTKASEINQIKFEDNNAFNQKYDTTSAVIKKMPPVIKKEVVFIARQSTKQVSSVTEEPSIHREPSIL